jgi:choline monooxygenase
MHFDIDPDVARARTLDKRFYLDPEAWALARERIFGRAWTWLGDLADVDAAGSLSPRTLLPGLLDEPLLLARDVNGHAGAGPLRCLSNVCTHRGNLLVHAPCRSAADIRCGYHSRRFDLAGRMTFMPGFEGAHDFPGESDHLPAVPFGAWHGHGFAALQPAMPLAEVLQAIDERLRGTGIDGVDGIGGINTWPHDATRDRSFEFDAHWALYVENYLEGLHIPFVHAGLARTIDMADYRYERFPWCNLQLAIARPGEAAFAPAAGSPGSPASLDEGERVAAYYFWVWPNLMLNFYPWGLSVNLVLPLAPARTQVIFRSYVRDASLLAQGAGGALDPVELEDEAVVLGVQRGIRARLYERGRYSPRHERGVHQFHRLVAEAMARA